MPCGKCCGHLAKRASVAVCGRTASGDSGGQVNDGSDHTEGSCGSENEVGSAGSSAFSDASEGSASKEEGNWGQAPQLVSWVDSAPAVTSPSAVWRKRVLSRAATAGRRRARDLEVLGLALDMRRGC